MTVRYTERLAGAGAVPSIGTVDDSYDGEHPGVAAIGV